MDELHAAIAAYLRGQRRTSEVRRPASEVAREATILGLWRARCGVPRCRYCGTPIDDRDGSFPVEELLLARACAAHHNRYW